MPWVAGSTVAEAIAGELRGTDDWTAVLIDPKRQEAIGWQHCLRTVGQETDREQRMARIYAMVENIDAAVGRILERLDELKLAEDTIVLYMHDNGPQQKRFNANLRGLKGSVYEGGIRSPLFVRWAGKTTPREIDKLAGHIDLFPTLLELCGVKEEPVRPIDGISLAPFVLGASWGPMMPKAHRLGN